MLLVASETGVVYTFATRKLQPIITRPEGKTLINTCLQAPDSGDEGPDASEVVADDTAAGIHERPSTASIDAPSSSGIGNPGARLEAHGISYSGAGYSLYDGHALASGGVHHHNGNQDMGSVGVARNMNHPHSYNDDFRGTEGFPESDGGQNVHAEYPGGMPPLAAARYNMPPTMESSNWTRTSHASNDTSDRLRMSQGETDEALLHSSSHRS